MELIIRTLLHFFFPAFCLHCGQKCIKSHQRLCSSCFQELEWIDTKQCCNACSRLLEGERRSLCPSCRERICYVQPHYSLFPAHPAILSLFHDFRKTKHPQSCKTLASLLILGLYRLPWPAPDVIVPFPKSRLDILFLRRQESFLLGKTLSKMLGCILCPF